MKLWIDYCSYISKMVHKGFELLLDSRLSLSAIHYL